jgi:hypothetical protein
VIAPNDPETCGFSFSGSSDAPSSSLAVSLAAFPSPPSIEFHR